MKKSVFVGTFVWISVLAVLAFFWWPLVMSQAAEPTSQVVSSQLPSKPLTKMIEEFRLPRMGASTGTNLKIGDVLPSLKCADLEGKPIEINDLYGEKATLIVCWWTLCTPCVSELPHELFLGRVYRDKGLKVIGVNADEDPARAKVLIESFHIEWPMIHEPVGHESADGIIKRLDIKSWPTLLLFDGNRKLISATPDLRRTHLVRDSAGNSYSARSFDFTITKTLGPVNSIPFIAPVE